jgi:DnaJ-class molecular chaperone
MPPDDIPEEEVTSPDLARPSCPNCRGTGEALVTRQVGTAYSGRPGTCDFCHGERTVSRERYAEYGTA